MGKLKLAIVGCGRIAPKHAESMAKIEQVELVAVCDIEKQQADSFAAKYQAKAYYDYNEMLADENIDVVNICTPSGLHASMGIAAAMRKKHVIVEKPMAMNLEEAENLINACQNNNVKLAVAHQNRFNPAVKMLREAYERGKFGKLLHGNAAIRWNRGLGYYQQASWRGTWEMDGGCLMNQCIHNIDLLQWFMGPVASLHAYADTKISNTEAPDMGVAVLKFKNGAFGIIEGMNTVYPKNLEETLSIFGDKGTAALGGIAVNKIEAWRFKEDFAAEEKAIIEKQAADPPDVYGYGHQALIADFAEAVINDRVPFISGEEGIKALEIILAMFQSAKSGMPVQFPLDKKYRAGE